MTKEMKDKFFVYLDDIGPEVEAATRKDFMRGAMVSHLCLHFWPELTRVQAEQVVNEWRKIREPESAECISELSH